MVSRRVAECIGTIFLILVTMLWSGYANAERQQKVQEQVVTESLLEKAGFQKWQVNQNTPKREALLSALPTGTIVIYRRGGTTYHAYGDKVSRIIYIGDEAAYQRYLSLAQGRKLCKLREGGESVGFWSCLEEFQQGRGVQPGR